MLGAILSLMFLVLAPSALAEWVSLEPTAQVSFAKQMAYSGGIRIQVSRFGVEIEDDLGSGTSGMLRSLGKSGRKVSKIIKASARYWAELIGGIAALVLIVVIVGSIDAQLLVVWRDRGLAALGRECALGAVVFGRLLLDRRTPATPKLLIVFSVGYALAGGDLWPERFGWIGFLDDAVLLILASRSFGLACSDQLVHEHAIIAARILGPREPA